MGKKIWIATGIVAAVVGVTALVAHAERGHFGGGYRGHHGDWGDGGERGHHGWRGRWKREMTKEAFDAKTRSKFARLDANADGAVDKVEAESAVGRRMDRRHHRRGRGILRHILNRYDTDRDGKVSKAEAEAHVTERFARLDLTGDGRITDDDLPPIMRGLGILSGEAKRRHRGWGRGHHRGRRHHGRRGGKRMIRYLYGADTDKDGAVTLQEMQDRAAKRFARFDHNKDGAIDEADRDTMRKDMLDYRVARLMHRYGGKDGKVTLEKYTAHRNKRFARRDLNGNGIIERDEMRGGRRGGWRHRGRHDDDRGYRRGGEDRGDRKPENRDRQ